MKQLFVTNEVPENATILLVDLEQKYFDEVLEFEEPTEQAILNERIDERLKEMKEKLLQLKSNGHTILSTNAGELYPGFGEIPDEYLPRWDSDMVEMLDTEDSTKNETKSDPSDIGGSFSVDTQVIQRMENEEVVIVCGLWKELCVYIVSRKLQEKYGKKILLYTGKDLTLENGIMWLDDDIVTLKAVCERDQVEIKHVNKMIA